MGFCLLQESGHEGFYFAVNSSHVDDILPQRDTADGYSCCLLKFSFTIKGFRALVLGSRKDVERTVMQAAKIGVQKIEAQTFVGRKTLHATPLILNKVDRVALVRELLPEQFTRHGIKSPTASELIMHDGMSKIIAERPGVFASRTNAERKVPVLTVR